jgi:hypothetical protein
LQLEKTTAKPFIRRAKCKYELNENEDLSGPIEYQPPELNCKSFTAGQSMLDS